MLMLGTPRRFLIGLAVVALLINVVSVGLRLVNLRLGYSVSRLDVPDAELVPGLRILSVDLEGNVPTWFNGSLLLVSALACWGMAVLCRQTAMRWRHHWMVLAAAFAYLSLDEVAGLHEKLMPYVERVVEPNGLWRFSWVLVAAPLTALFALGLLGWLRHLPVVTRRLVLLAGAMYVGGAVGLEMVGGYLYDREKMGDSVPYVLASSGEELAEMLSLTLFLYAISNYAAGTARDHGAVPAGPRRGLLVECPSCGLDRPPGLRDPGAMACDVSWRVAPRGRT